MMLFALIVSVVILQLFIEDETFTLFAKLAVLLYLLQWLIEGIVYIGRFFRIG